MFRPSSLIGKECQKILVSRRRAVLWVLVLSFVPITLSIALAILALTVLRKGWQEGVALLMPILVIQCLLTLPVGSVLSASVYAMSAVLPCFISACVLRTTNSWRWVTLVLFLFLCLVSIALHLSGASFIEKQFLTAQSMLNEIQPGGILSQALAVTNKDDALLYANYLFGVQAVALSLSALLALMLARGIQARLFYPGGLKQELLTYRGSKVSALMLVLLFVGAMQKQLLAVDLLPFLTFCFFFAGLSLTFHALSHKRTLMVSVVLLMPLLLLPMAFLPVYVVLGLLDGFFDFRVYLPKRAC